MYYLFYHCNVILFKIHLDMVHTLVTLELWGTLKIIISQGLPTTVREEKSLIFP